MFYLIARLESVDECFSSWCPNCALSRELLFSRMPIPREVAYSMALDSFLEACREMDKLPFAIMVKFYYAWVAVRRQYIEPSDSHAFALAMGPDFCIDHSKLLKCMSRAQNIAECYSEVDIFGLAAQAYLDMRRDYEQYCPYEEDELNGPAWHSCHHEYAMYLAENGIMMETSGELNKNERYWG